jgi:hypothetical protein
MPPNRVLSARAIKTVFNKGQEIMVKYATKTEGWERTFLATSVQDDFSNAVEKADVPARAATAILA